MSKRLQILLDEEEYLEIQAVARDQQLSVAEWVRRTLRKARYDPTDAVKAKLRAIAEASQHEFPTADIGTMLREIEEGRKLL